MRVTILGHAGLVVETADQRILVDPVLRRTLAGGALTFSPQRSVRTGRIPPPTALVITHGHFDHFDPDSLSRFQKELPIIVSDGQLARSVAALGFTHVLTLLPWQELRVGQTSVVGTPSNWVEPEIGVLIREHAGSIWDMGDSEPDQDIARRLVEEQGSIDVVATKFQPVNRSSVNYLFGVGSTFEKAEVFRWLEAACCVRPHFVFPYSAGLCFRGPHAWFNRYSFPFSAAPVAALLQRRLGPSGRAQEVRPGDVVKLDANGVRHERQASPFVREVPSPPQRWEPVDVSTLASLSSAAQRDELRARLDELVFGPLADWLRGSPAGESPWLRALVAYGIVWQLVVHAGVRQRLHYAFDFRRGSASITRGEHPDANCFEHLSGRVLLQVLRKQAPGRLLLVGAVRLYENIVDVRDGQFWAPPARGAALFEQIGEPLQYYLRRFAGDAGGSIN